MVFVEMNNLEIYIFNFISFNLYTTFTNVGGLSITINWYLFIYLPSHLQESCTTIVINERETLSKQENEHEEYINCCLMNATSQQPWYKIEYQNLSDLSDWVGCAYIFTDVNIGVLYETLLNGDDLETDGDLYEDVHEMFYEQNKQVILLFIFYFFTLLVQFALLYDWKN